MSSKFARAGVAPREKTLTSAVSRIRRGRSVMTFVLPMLSAVAVDVGDAELPFQGGQVLQIDGVDDVYDGELFWFCRDDEKAGDGVAAGVGLNIHILARPAGDFHDLLPRRL